MKVLIDTNIISEAIAKKPNSKVIVYLNQLERENCFLSIITIGEIKRGILTCPVKERKEKLRHFLDKLEEHFEHRVLPIDSKVIEAWSQITSRSKRTLPVVDSMIAATSVAYDLELITRNEKDFTDLKIRLYNPFS